MYPLACDSTQRQGGIDMKIETIAFRNDGNYVSEDGTTFVMKFLNPAYGEKDEPEYITQEVPINPNDEWVINAKI